MVASVSDPSPENLKSSNAVTFTPVDKLYIPPFPLFELVLDGLINPTKRYHSPCVGRSVANQYLLASAPEPSYAYRFKVASVLEKL